MGKKKKKSNLLREMKQLATPQRSASAKQEASFRRFEEQAQTFGAKTIRSTDGQLQMSEIIDEFLGGYISKKPTLAEYQNLMPLVLVAWNTALTPIERHNDMINSFMQMALPNSDPIENHDLRNILEMMIEDKLENFAEFDRVIVNYEVYEAGGEIHLSIASKLTEDELD